MGFGKTMTNSIHIVLRVYHFKIDMEIVSLCYVNINYVVYIYVSGNTKKNWFLFLSIKDWYTEKGGCRILNDK